jgi:hypothetical protein
VEFHIHCQGIPEYINGDKVRLNQILINIICNALKFTNKGSVDVFVEKIIFNTEYSTIKFSVIDTGIGIADNKLEKIFERFEQADKAIKTKYGGSGLGLSISKTLIELQEGRIEVKSRLNIGSTFSFILRFKVPNADEIAEYINLNKTSLICAPDYKNRKILLTEDIELNRKLILKILEATNCKVVCAENGKRCIENLQKNKYDLINNGFGNAGDELV